MNVIQGTGSYLGRVKNVAQANPAEAVGIFVAGMITEGITKLATKTGRGAKNVVSKVKLGQMAANAANKFGRAKAEVEEITEPTDEVSD